MNGDYDTGYRIVLKDIIHITEYATEPKVVRPTTLVRDYLDLPQAAVVAALHGGRYHTRCAGRCTLKNNQAACRT